MWLLGMLVAEVVLICLFLALTLLLGSVAPVHANRTRMGSFTKLEHMMRIALFIIFDSSLNDVAGASHSDH